MYYAIVGDQYAVLFKSILRSVADRDGGVWVYKGGGGGSGVYK